MSESINEADDTSEGTEACLKVIMDALKHRRT